MIPKLSFGRFAFLFCLCYLDFEVNNFMNKVESSFSDLIQMFHLIARKRWIKSVNKGLGSIGYTFENELGKAPDSLYLPDYNGVEIKCTGRYSRYPITLFTVAFDGPTFPEINRIIDLYGVADKDFNDKKVLFATLCCRRMISVSPLYKFKLDIDYEEEKIYLCVYDDDGNFIERKSFVYFKSIYNHLVLKLNKLAVVYASKKVIEGITYFRYYKIDIYRFTDFDNFLLLLNEGIIKVKLISRISKSGNDIGRYRNKNLVFMIDKCDLDRLFDRVYFYDYDN